MNLKRLFGTAFVLGSLLAGGIAIVPRVAHGTDLQDSPTLVAHPAADINDVYLFPSPAHPNDNVVLVMDVNPNIASSNSSMSFDPAVLYQFKIAHSSAPFTKSSSNAATVEDTVIQFLPNGSGSGQSLTMYGPAAPNITGSTSTVLNTSQSAGKTFTLGHSATVTVADDALGSAKTYTMSIYAGLVPDRSFFDLARFYRIFPDRNPANHTTGQAIPSPSATSFAGTPCDSSTSVDYFSSQGLKTLAIVVEIPRALLAQTPGTTDSTKHYVHMWATTSTVSGS